MVEFTVLEETIIDVQSKNDCSYQMPPPLLGASTNDVLSQQLNLSAAQIAELISTGVIG